jgi:hypothetical protein
MEDLTIYSDDELSLHVMNDEALYNLRKYPAALEEAIYNLFKFTAKQYEVLQQDISDQR